MRILGVMASMGLSIFIGRNLGASDLGSYSALRSVFVLLTAVAFMGMPKEIVRQFAMSRESAKDRAMILASTMSLAVPLGLGASVIYVLAVILFDHGNQEDFEILLVGVLSVLFQIVNGIMASALIGNKMLVRASFGKSSLAPMFQLSLLLLIYLVEDVTLMRVVQILTLSQFLTSLALVHFLRDSITHIDVKSLWEKATEIRKNSRSLFVVSIADIAYGSLTILILDLFVESAQVAYFNVAMRLLLVVNLAQQLLNGYFSPLVTNFKEREDCKKLEGELLTVSRASILASVFGFVLVVVLGKPVLSLWGSEFHQAYVPLLILSAGWLIDFSSGVTSPVLYLNQKTELLRRISMLSLLSIIVFGFVTSKFYGICGLSVVVAMTKMGEALLKTWYISRHLKLAINPLASWLKN